MDNAGMMGMMEWLLRRVRRTPGLHTRNPAFPIEGITLEAPVQAAQNVDPVRLLAEAGVGLGASHAEGLEEAAMNPAASEPTLDPTNLKWEGVRFLDPTGRVFRYGAAYFRAIYPHAAERIRVMLQSGIADLLAERGWMPAVKEARFGVAGYDLVLEAATPAFEVPPSNWPLAMLRDAAIVFCDINLELLRKGRGLADGHLGNFAQDAHARPIWVDLGSIDVMGSDDLRGIAEFCRCVFHPLLLMGRGVSGRVIRCLLKEGGLDAAELRALGIKPTTLQGNREETLKALRELAEEWIVPEQQTASNRYNDIESYSESLEPNSLQPAEQNRTAAISRIFNQYRPARVVDLGGNAGFFSLLAHKAGSAVVAFDNDETAIEQFYHYLRAHPMGGNLQIGVRDIFSNDILPKGDCVLALALVHHLCLSQQFPFAFIAETFAQYTTRLLITEFMPNGLGKSNPEPNPLPKGYHLDAFLVALQSHFARVETIDYPYPADHCKRILVFCRDRI